jgi:NADH-quinone oxidoreductase subunit A
MNELVAVLLMVALGAGTVVLLLFLSSWLGPKRRTSIIKETPFETGFAPIELPGQRLSIKFYMIAILFVVFDIEIVFLFPWATVFRELGVAGLVSMGLFIAILVLGLAYAWKRGALEWE